MCSAVTSRHVIADGDFQQEPVALCVVAAEFVELHLTVPVDDPVTQKSAVINTMSRDSRKSRQKNGKKDTAQFCENRKTRQQKFSLYSC